MSRFYRMEMEVSMPRTTIAQWRVLGNIFAEQWFRNSMSFLETLSEEGHMTFSSEGSLFSESEREAHARIVRAVKAKFPECNVKTRWIYLEELPFTEYRD